MITDDTFGLSRRDFLASSAVAVTMAWLGPQRLFAQEAAKSEGIVQAIRNSGTTAKIEVQKLRGQLHALIGSGGNISVLLGKDGKFLVDAGLATSQKQIAEALSSLSADPIKHVLNTHWHFDHTDGNLWLHESGATIVAHENVRKRLNADTRVDDWDFTFKQSPAGALPTKEFKNDHSFHLNDNDVAVEYFGSAHTDGDVSAHFKNLDVLSTGDTFWNNHFPFIDYSTGGSIDGMIRATEANLKKAGTDTIIVPGHGPVANKAQLLEFRDMLATVRESVAAMKKQGKTANEAVAAKPTAKFDAIFGTFVIDGAFFTQLVYKGV